MALGDFGIQNNTKSSALGSTSRAPDLASLLSGSTMAQNLANAQALGQQAAGLQGQEEPSLLQRLLSPGGLALLAGTIGAGTQAGGAGAAAFGLGGIQGIQGAVAAEREARAGAVKQLQDSRDAELDRADKSMNRVSNLIASNPDLFNDPNTGEQRINESLLGFLATGEPIMLSTSARRKLARTGEDADRRHEVLMEALKQEDTVEGASVITGAIFKNMGWSDVPANVSASVARSLGTPDFDATMVNLFKEHGGTSGLQAMIHAADNGLPLSDASVLRMIDWKEKESDELTPSQLENLRVLELDAELNAFQQDAANRTVLSDLRGEAGDDQVKFMSELVNKAFAGRSGDISLYLTNRRVLADNNEFRTYLNAWAQSGAITEIAEVLTSVELAGMNPEDQLRYKAGLANRTFDAMLNNMRESTAIEDAVQRNNSISRVIQELGFDQSSSSRLVDAIIKDATDKSGRINAEEVQRLLGVAIQQFKDRE